MLYRFILPNRRNSLLLGYQISQYIAICSIPKDNDRDYQKRQEKNPGLPLSCATYPFFCLFLCKITTMLQHTLFQYTPIHQNNVSKNPQDNPLCLRFLTYTLKIIFCAKYEKFIERCTKAYLKIHSQTRLSGKHTKYFIFSSKHILKNC